MQAKCAKCACRHWACCPCTRVLSGLGTCSAHGGAPPPPAAALPPMSTTGDQQAHGKHAAWRAQRPRSRAAGVTPKCPPLPTSPFYQCTEPPAILKWSALMPPTPTPPPTRPRHTHTPHPHPPRPSHTHLDQRAADGHAPDLPPLALVPPRHDHRAHQVVFVLVVHLHKRGWCAEEREWCGSMQGRGCG